MKKLFALVLVTLIIALMIPGSLMADSPQKETNDKPSLWPPPITDPSEAVPFSHSNKDKLDPNSPSYSVNEKYGPAGSRFGPPGQRSLKIPSPIPSDNYFGTL